MAGFLIAGVEIKAAVGVENRIFGVLSDRVVLAEKFQSSAFAGSRFPSYPVRIDPAVKLKPKFMAFVRKIRKRIKIAVGRNALTSA